MSCDGQLCSGTETSMWYQVRFYFVRFFNRIALNVHVKTDGSHSALALLIQLFQPLLLVEVRALITLGASTKFRVQSELNDFFGFFRLAIANENGHNLFFFSEGILTNLAAMVHQYGGRKIVYTSGTYFGFLGDLLSVLIKQVFT